MLKCSHVLLADKEFPTCAMCGEVWFDEVAFERATKRKAKAATLPTAATLAKAINEGAARQYRLNVPLSQSPVAKTSYYET